MQQDGISRSARQRVRDFVRIKQWAKNRDNVETQFARSDAENDDQEEQAKLAIYTQLLRETNYALPLVPHMSTEMKKERLRNAYRACLISNEILKQLNHEAEVFTNIVAIRHRVSGLWVYINRDTRQEVPCSEYLKRYTSYLSHSKVVYDDPEELERMLEQEDVDGLSDVEREEEVEMAGGHIDGVAEEEDSRSSSESEFKSGNRERGSSELRKRCSSTASATDEEHSCFGSRAVSRSNSGSNSDVNNLINTRSRSNSSPFADIGVAAAVLARSDIDGMCKKLRVGGDRDSF
jgi:hypothetical protein